MLTKMTLFEARTDGFWNYRVPGILCTPNGVILVSAEARRGTGGDWDGNDVLLRRSLDGSVTWESPQVVVRSAQYGDGPIANFVMISDRAKNSVHAVYCYNYERVFWMRSADDGASFSEPLEITAVLEKFRKIYPWRVIATGPGHGIQLANDRLIVPVWISNGGSARPGARKLNHHPSEVAVIYSDDHGITWQCGEFAARTGKRIIHPSETAVVELSDGRVLFNIRSESKEKRRLISISPDGVHDWSPPQFDDTLLEPVCLGSILKLRQTTAQGTNMILFANPDNLENDLIPPGGRLAHDRKRLTVKMSQDNCQTWPISKVLESGPSGYSDLAEASGGVILCIYECGMMTHMCDPKTLTLARFDTTWLLGK
jgi:sialidase-1